MSSGPKTQAIVTNRGRLHRAVAQGALSGAVLQLKPVHQRRILNRRVTRARSGPIAPDLNGRFLMSRFVLAFVIACGAAFILLAANPRPNPEGKATDEK